MLQAANRLNRRFNVRSRGVVFRRHGMLQHQQKTAAGINACTDAGSAEYFWLESQIDAGDCVNGWAAGYENTIRQFSHSQQSFARQLGGREMNMREFRDGV